VNGLITPCFRQPLPELNGRQAARRPPTSDATAPASRPFCRGWTRPSSSPSGRL